MCSDPNRQEKKYTSKNHVPSESLVISFCCWVKVNSQYIKFVIKLIKAIIQNNNNYYYFFISLKQLEINKHCHHGFWKQVWFVLIFFLSWLNVATGLMSSVRTRWSWGIIIFVQINNFSNKNLDFYLCIYNFVSVLFIVIII